MKKISGNPFIKNDKGKILFDEFNLSELLKISDTPLMIVLENRIRDNLRKFNKVFRSLFDKYYGFYSFKANYLPEVCNIIKSEKFGAEVISLPELELAIKIGFPPDMIIAGGPYLTDKFVRRCILNEIREIVVYHLDDLERIDKTAYELGNYQNVCLRINSTKYDSRLGINFSEKKIKKLTKICQKVKNIRITTILSHFSTQMNDINQHIKNLDNVINIRKKLLKSGIEIDKVNLGGGFPEAVVMPESQLKIIASELYDHLIERGNGNLEIYFEPGRYLVGDAGVFITEVINSENHRWIFLNLGTNLCPKFARSSIRFYNASKINQAHKYKTNISGIVPTDQDVLAKNYFFTKATQKGDIIIITNVGAYNLTFSNRFPYPLPPIYMITGRNVLKIFDPLKDRDFSIKNPRDQYI